MPETFRNSNTTKIKSIRFNNINFLRLFFTLIIVYGHIIQHFMMPMLGHTDFYLNLNISYSFGYMCDMFFIISGFFMYFSFKKNTNFKTFIITKLVRLEPVLIFSFIGIFVLSLFFKSIESYKVQNLLGLFFLNNSFNTNIITNNNYAWYINVMFWGYIFYYCLNNIIPKKIINYVIGLIIFFMYSILLNKLELYAPPPGLA